MQHARKMVLVDERIYEAWKKSPDERLKTSLYEKTKEKLENDTIPDDIKAKQIQNDFIRFQLAGVKQSDDVSLPIWPELVKKKPRQSKRKKEVKWEKMY
jgi:hypothetical protein